MLSLTIFAAAASAATQPAAASTVVPPAPPPIRQAEAAADPVRPMLDRSATLWRFADPAIDGGQIWL